jgi:hypothetical protein
MEQAFASESYFLVDFHNFPLAPSAFSGLFSGFDERSGSVKFPPHFLLNIPFLLNVIIHFAFILFPVSIQSFLLRFPLCSALKVVFIK